MPDKRILLIFFSYLLFFVLIPPLQIPDEPSHYENIYWVSRFVYPFLPTSKQKTNKLFVDKIIKIYDLNEVSNNPYILPNFRKINSLYSITNEKPTTNLSQISSQAYHPPLYYLFGGMFFKAGELLSLNLIDQFYLVRLVSSFFYFGCVLIAEKILKTICKNNNTAKNILVFFSINPLILQIGVGINNDIAVVFFSLIFLYLLIRSANTTWLAIVAGLATLSKFSGIFTVLVFTTLTLFKKISRQKKIKEIIKFVLVDFVILLPWLVFNFLRYGNPLIDNFYIFSEKKTLSYSFFSAIVQAMLEFRHTIMHYAGFIGWYQTYPFKIFFLLYTVIFTVLALFGLFKISKDKKKNFYPLVIYLFSLLLFLYLLSLRHKLLGYSWDIQGRYLATGFLPLVIFIAQGLNYIFGIKVEKVSHWLCWWAIFHFNFILIFVLIPKYYV